MFRLVFVLLFFVHTSAIADRSDDVLRGRLLVDSVWATAREVMGIHGKDRDSMLRLHAAVMMSTEDHRKEQGLCSELMYPVSVKGNPLAFSIIMHTYGMENPTAMFWGVSMVWPNENRTKAAGMVRFFYEQSYENNLPKGEPVFHVDFRHPYAKDTDPNRRKNLLAGNGEWGMPGEEKTYPVLVRDNDAPMWLNALYVLSHLHPKRFAEWCSLKDAQKEEKG